MNKILIKNGNVVLFEKQGNIDLKTVVKNTDILIEDDKIIKVEKDIIDSDAKFIDATGKIVMPGLINMHAHVPMSVFREMIDGCTLEEWLNNKIFPMEDKLTPNDVYYTSMLSLIEACKTGTTLLNDNYFFTDKIIEATHSLPIRCVPARSLLGSNTSDNIRITEMLNLYNAREDDINTNIYSVISLHGLYTTDEEYVKMVSRLCTEYNFSLHMHFCESSKEVESIKKMYNVKYASEVLQKHFEGINLILAHCVKLESKDFETLLKLRANVVHNPLSNLRLGCGIADIAKMQRLGINVCLGTDGQGSGSNLDMFEAMNVASLIQKGYQEDPTVLDDSTIIQMATINGAKALKMEDKIGSIEVGKLADVIIIDTSDITLQPINNILSNIVHNIKGRDVTHTIINGKLLMENKKLTLNIDEKEIINKCLEISKKISK